MKMQCVDNKESRKGHMADALALGGDEGRDKLRKAAEIGKYEMTRRCPNGETYHKRLWYHAKREANAGNWNI